MPQDYKALASRVEALEQKVPDLATYLHSALDYISADPQSSLTKSRVTLEKLLLKLYRHAMNCDPRRPMIGDMLADKTFVAQIPKRILARMNAVRDMSNLGPHGEDVDMTDATRVMHDLIDVLEWYVVNYDPAPGAIGNQKPRDAVEILLDLKNRFSNFLRPDIISVKFAQSDGRCYLETTSAELVAGYLRNETVRREDLAFIMSDAEANEVMFDPTDPVAINAQKFLSEMDPISIINCTDLFTLEVAAEIDRSWQATGDIPDKV